jgi:hypothetical protein
MFIVTEDYSIKYDADTTTINWQGVMRLNGKEYDPIAELLNEVATLKPSKITLNLQELEGLNSSGLTMLGKFIFKLAKKTTIELLIQGSKKMIWQKKSIKNFQRLMPRLQLEWD